MQALATKSAETATSKNKKAEAHSASVSPWYAQPVTVIDGPVIQRQPNCACGGGCPRCQEQERHQSIQTKLAISTPGDLYEQEADRVAEQVLNVPENESPGRTGLPQHTSGIGLQRKCAECSSRAQ